MHALQPIEPMSPRSQTNDLFEHMSSTVSSIMTEKDVLALVELIQMHPKEDILDTMRILFQSPDTNQCQLRQIYSVLVRAGFEPMSIPILWRSCFNHLMDNLGPIITFYTKHYGGIDNTYVTEFLLRDKHLFNKSQLQDIMMDAHTAIVSNKNLEEFYSIIASGIVDCANS